MKCLLCKNCCANQEDNFNNEMIINDEEKNDNIANEQYNKKICQICASAIDKYPSILKRMSNVELYYLCENFLARDKFNEKKRSDKEIANKLISFAKGECVDWNDIKKLKENDNFDFLKNNIKDKDKNIKELGIGAEKAIFSLKKQHLLPSKNENNNITFAIVNGYSNYFSAEQKGEIGYMAYDYFIICTKILLSLFARQTKYYNTFIMKEIKCDKQLNCKEIDIRYKDDYIPLIEAEFENISNNEKHKEIARELFFGHFDHSSINSYTDRRHNSPNLEPYLHKNRMLDKNGKIIDIDLCWAKPVEKKDFDQILGFVRKTQAFDLSEIFSNLKKNLTISPKMIAYHTLMELKKYDFKDFNDDKHADCIKETLKAYQRLLSATKDNFAEIDKDVVKICENQLTIYNEYLEKIDKYSLKDFENDFQEEQKQITVEINKYSKMKRTIKGMTKKTTIPLSVCCNDVSKINKKDNNKKKGNLFVVKKW